MDAGEAPYALAQEQGLGFEHAGLDHQRELDAFMRRSRTGSLVRLDSPIDG